MPRLFTGLEIPSSIALQLSLLQGGLRGARWIDPESYHITLRFIGDIEDRLADEVSFELGRVQRQQISVELDGLGSFGNGKPHAVWARVKPTSALAEMQGEQERILQRLGLPAEKRKYTPHVTLARLRNTDSTSVAKWLELHGGFRIAPFVAARFVLFSARSSVGGGPYLVEEAFPLAA
ncbi:RNA 2',3'-cyclic phosphodiesterase [Polycladidibacter hongkongensis]|uniref:RNA 2',3'-cyclic phosphodiesterase n=1 Tax=Polycladidibacter hongkongensis TaxID=1647556 RepID=UPI00082C2E34|nr:RNA 2',3'-cyclic phosphodiesterase [Pseudovibrio hongkongensis]